MPDRVFISHASKDHEIAAAVCDAIERRGVQAWIAPRDIAPGSDYAAALYDAIGECTALVLVFSEHANASPQVRRELERAWRDGDPIIAFRIDDAVPIGALEFMAGAIEWVAPSTVDLSTHIAIVAEMVGATVDGRRYTPPALTDGGGPQPGSPAVVRRLCATWLKVLLWIALVCAAGDLVGNADAISNELFSRTLFDEEDVAVRVAGLLGIVLILAPAIGVLWLVWLCGAYLTVEAAAVDRVPIPARRAPHRFLWPGIRFDGAAAVIAHLWDGVNRLPNPPASAAPLSPRAPRGLWLMWLAGAVTIPLTIVAVIAADTDEWTDLTIVSWGLAADVVWVIAATFGLRVMKALERRMRETDMTAPVSVKSSRSVRVSA